MKYRWKKRIEKKNKMARKTDDESTSEKYEDVEYSENCNV